MAKRGKWAGINRARARTAGGGRLTSRAEKARAVILRARELAGEIVAWKHEALKLRLGHRCTYEPDFLVIELDGAVVLEEIKGAMGWKLDDEGRTKWKVAAELFPWFVFRGLIRNRDGSWEEPEEYVPTQPFGLDTA